MKFADARGFGQCGGGVNHSDTMSRLSRRSFLAGSTAALAAPALRASAQAADVDLAIVGAGAAGIAAARRAIAAKASVALFEAGHRVGGRCVTDSALFGVPFDLGAHWLHDPENNPLAAQAAKLGLEVYPAPRGQVLRVGPRPARASELENFLAALLRSRRAIDDAGRGKADVAAARALPDDLGVWQSTIEFALGPFVCGKDLGGVAAADLAHAGARDRAAFCRQGYGTLLARLAAGLPVRLSAPVTRIDWYRDRIELATARGRLRARTAIVTASTNALVADTIEFEPDIPRNMRESMKNLTLGSYDHIALLMPGNPLDLQRDDLVFEQSAGPRTAALLGRVAGSDLHVIEVAGGFGRELSAKGETAMLDFARAWLASLFGSGVVKAITRNHVTRWNEQPYVLGAMSSASPGNTNARNALVEPLGGRVWFAGEALHATKWGTVDGAWESGERAANRALRRMGFLKEPGEARPSRRHRDEHERPRRRRRHGDN
jgi:monoamine oxidase